MSIAPIICTVGSFADCIPFDRVPLKQHNMPVHSDHLYFSVPFYENFKEWAGLNQKIWLQALWYFFMLLQGYMIHLSRQAEKNNEKIFALSRRL